MKRLLLLTACLAALARPAFAESDISVSFNGEPLATEQPPVVFNDRTLVPVRAVCEAMGLKVDWDEKTKGITVYDEETVVKLGIDYFNIDVNGINNYIESPPKLVNGFTCVPIRYVVEPFGAMVDWDEKSRTVIINLPDEEEEDNSSASPNVSKPSGSGGSSGTGSSSGNNQTENIPPVAENKPTEAPEEESKPTQTPTTETESKPTQTPKPEAENKPADSQTEANKEFTFYPQAGEEWAFESNGRGYCWVCSYAMLITDITGERITPVEIAEFNIEKGFDGNYIASHFGIADKYGLKFVPALSENSEYFKSYDKERRGATYFEAETDEDVKNALIEALSQNPKGVLVRFEGYPHTLVATEYRDGEIYFNDPGQLTMENVTFENTALGKRFKWTDLSFVQAMEIK